MGTVFVSYTRRSGDVVKTLVGDFEALGHSVWFDQDLSGGHAWWSQILQRIRECDIFVFVLDSDSLDSTACQRECAYATGLRKTILPILVSGDVSVNLLPPGLSQIQFVDYRARDRDAVLRLARALSSLPPVSPLPDPLPPPPEAPMSYLGNLTSQVEADTLTYEQQSALLVDLRRHLREPGTAGDARTLLEKLRKRRDLFATIADEIADIKASSPQLAQVAEPRNQHVVVQSVATPAPAPVPSRVVQPRVLVPEPVPAPASARTPEPEPEPARVTAARFPTTRERLIGAVIGMIGGGLAGVVAVSGTDESIGFSLVTGGAAAIAGAITGLRARLAAVAALAAVIAWVVVVGTLEGMPAIGGAVLGASPGVVFAAIFGVLLRKKIPWLDPPS